MDVLLVATKLVQSGFLELSKAREVASLCKELRNDVTTHEAIVKVERSKRCRTALMFYALSNNLERVLFLIQCGSSKYRVDMYGKPAAIYAVSHGAIDTLEAVLPEKINQLYFGKTLLSLAVEMGNYDICAYLLQKGADPTASDNVNQYRSLHYSSCAKISQLLLQNGAFIDQPSSSGITPLMISTNNENTLFLLMNGADVLAMDDRQKSVLLHAVIYDDFYKASVVVCPTTINLPDYAGRRPLHMAKSYRMMKFLIENGASANVYDENKASPLHNVCSDNTVLNSQLKIDALLNASSRATCNSFDCFRRTPLKMAIYTYNYEIFCTLVENEKIDINACEKIDDNVGMCETALHYCMRNYAYNVRDREEERNKFMAAAIFKLLQHGAHSNIPFYGQTAKDLAIEKNLWDFLPYMR